MLKALNVIFVTLWFSTPSLAQVGNFPGGSMGGPIIGGNYGSFPSITTNEWSDRSKLPTYDSEIEVPFQPDDLDRWNSGGDEVPPPGLPTIIDLISEGDNGPVETGIDSPIVEDPQSLSLPDLDDVAPDDSIFPVPDVVTGLIEEEILQEYGTSPIFSMDQLPSSIKDCAQLPRYGAIEYAMDLKNPEIDQDRYLEIHTLWIKTRICKKGGSLTESNSLPKILNKADNRCVFYTGQNFKDDMANADSEEELKVIQKLYDQYLFSCF